MGDPEGAVAVHFAGAMTALGFARNQPLAVAFSGGGDSLALLALACDFAGSAKVTALIVDHGLRSESAQEARRAAKTAQALGAHPRILTWPNPRPGQARARTARYGLLAGACTEAGLDTVLVAHSRDDQEETFVLRLRTRSSVRGLACMSARAPMPVWPEGRGLWLARPLLGCSRADLRRFLRARGLAWIDDPSNQDARYGRVRVRRELARLYAHGLREHALGQAISALAALEDERRRQAARLLEQGVHWHAAGFALVRRDVLARAGQHGTQQMLAAVLAGVSGQGAQPLPAGLVARTAARLKGSGWTPFCAAGCRLQERADAVLVSRDPGAVLGRGAQTPQQAVLDDAGWRLFDNRFELHGPPGALVRSAGRDRSGLSPAQKQALADLPAAVRPTVPVMGHQALRFALSAPAGGADGGAARFLGPQIAARVLARFSQGLHQRV